MVRNNYDYQHGTMTFIKPGQVVKVENSSTIRDSNGWTLFFHLDLLRKYELGRTIESYSFFNYEVYEALHLSNEEKKSLTDLIEKIKLEYNQKIDRHSEDIIVANIEMILKYCKRYYDRQFNTRTHLSKDLIVKFEQLVQASNSHCSQL